MSCDLRDVDIPWDDFASTEQVVNCQFSGAWFGWYTTKKYGTKNLRSVIGAIAEAGART